MTNNETGTGESTYEKEQDPPSENTLQTDESIVEKDAKRKENEENIKRDVAELFENQQTNQLKMDSTRESKQEVQCYEEGREEEGQMSGETQVKRAKEKKSCPKTQSNEREVRGSGPIVSGSVVDIIRKLRQLSHIPFDLRHELENRRKPIDLRKECNQSCVPKHKENVVSMENGDACSFFQAENGGDESFFIETEPDDETTEADEEPHSFQDQVNALEEKSKSLKLEIQKLCSQIQDDKQQNTKLEYRVERREKLKAKIRSGLSKARTVAKMKANSKQAMEKKEREDAVEAAKKQASAADQRMIFLENRKKREELRGKMLEFMQMGRKTQEISVVKEQIRALMEEEERQGQKNGGLDLMPLSPVPNYWDGNSALRGLVFKPDGELCIWKDNLTGITPTLPAAIRSSLRKRDLALKRKRKNKLEGSI